MLLVLAFLLGCPGTPDETGEAQPPVETGSEDTGTPSSWVALGWPTRGMHPMDASYELLCLRPPSAGFEAQLLERALLPSLVTQDLALAYRPQIEGSASGESDFWTHAPALLGEDAPSEGLGLTGLSVRGQASLAAGADRFQVHALPVVPTQGSGDQAPFPLFELELSQGGDALLASTVAVVPSSWDRGCQLCHGDDPGSAILAAHDAAHGSSLAKTTPVRCGACHAQPDLGWEGDGQADVLARSMHGAHAERMQQLEGELETGCLACHPGPDTPFYRGNHSVRGVTCTDCHGSIDSLAAPERSPWQDLPRCDDCHATPSNEYQQEAVSFMDSVGHGGLRCPACHHAPHGLWASELDQDNAQNIELQGYDGVVSTCKVCHEPNPGGLFPHVGPG